MLFRSKTICPYGYLQGMLQDKQTLLVIYRDGKDTQKSCIECGKCVRVCEMGIDIRKSPYQIECVHCGECVDACEDVLRRIGKPGLIHYDWGEKGGAGKTEPWYLRWGFRDMKRAVIVFVLIAYLSGLALALSMRQPVLVRVAPDRSVLYRTLDDGRIANLFRITVANRGKEAATMHYQVDGLPGVEITLPESSQQLAPGQTLQTTFELRTRPWTGSTDVNHFRFVAQAEPGEALLRFPQLVERHGLGTPFKPDPAEANLLEEEQVVVGQAAHVEPVRDPGVRVGELVEDRFARASGE